MNPQITRTRVRSENHIGAGVAPLPVGQGPATLGQHTLAPVSNASAALLSEDRAIDSELRALQAQPCPQPADLDAPGEPIFEVTYRNADLQGEDCILIRSLASTQHAELHHMELRMAVVKYAQCAFPQQNQSIKSEANSQTIQWPKSLDSGQIRELVDQLNHLQRLACQARGSPAQKSSRLVALIRVLASNKTARRHVSGQLSRTTRSGSRLQSPDALHLAGSNMRANAPPPAATTILTLTTPTTTTTFTTTTAITATSPVTNVTKNPDPADSHHANRIHTSSAREFKPQVSEGSSRERELLLSKAKDRPLELETSLPGTGNSSATSRAIDAQEIASLAAFIEVLCHPDVGCELVALDLLDAMLTEVADPQHASALMQCHLLAYGKSQGRHTDLQLIMLVSHALRILNRADADDRARSLCESARGQLIEELFETAEPERARMIQALLLTRLAEIKAMPSGSNGDQHTRVRNLLLKENASAALSTALERLFFQARSLEGDAAAEIASWVLDVLGDAESLPGEGAREAYQKCYLDIAVLESQTVVEQARDNLAKAGFEFTLVHDDRGILALHPWRKSPDGVVANTEFRPLEHLDDLLTLARHDEPSLAMPVWQFLLSRLKSLPTQYAAVVIAAAVKALAEYAREAAGPHFNGRIHDACNPILSALLHRMAKLKAHKVPAGLSASEAAQSLAHNNHLKAAVRRHMSTLVSALATHHPDTAHAVLDGWKEAKDSGPWIWVEEMRLASSAGRPLPQRTARFDETLKWIDQWFQASDEEVTAQEHRLGITRAESKATADELWTCTIMAAQSMDRDGCGGAQIAKVFNWLAHRTGVLRETTTPSYVAWARPYLAVVELARDHIAVLDPKHLVDAMATLNKEWPVKLLIDALHRLGHLQTDTKVLQSLIGQLRTMASDSAFPTRWLEFADALARFGENEKPSLQQVMGAIPNAPAWVHLLCLPEQHRSLVIQATMLRCLPQDLEMVGNSPYPRLLLPVLDECIRLNAPALAAWVYVGHGVSPIAWAFVPLQDSLQDLAGEHRRNTLIHAMEEQYLRGQPVSADEKESLDFMRALTVLYATPMRFGEDVWSSDVSASIDGFVPFGQWHTLFNFTQILIFTSSPYGAKIELQSGSGADKGARSQLRNLLGNDDLKIGDWTLKEFIATSLSSLRDMHYAAKENGQQQIVLGCEELIKLLGVSLRSRTFADGTSKPSLVLQAHAEAYEFARHQVERRFGKPFLVFVPSQEAPSKAGD